MSMRLSWSSAAVTRSFNIGELALRLTQVFQNLGAEVLIELQDLQLDLACFSLGSRHVSGQRIALALQPRLVPAQLHHPLDADQVLCEKLLDSGKLLVDQPQLAILRV